jgi:hypothetical protein
LESRVEKTQEVALQNIVALLQELATRVEERSKSNGNEEPPVKGQRLRCYCVSTHEKVPEASGRRLIE